MTTNTTFQASEGLPFTIREGPHRIVATDEALHDVVVIDGIIGDDWILGEVEIIRLGDPLEVTQSDIHDCPSRIFCRS